MERKAGLDAFGTGALLFMALLFGLNNVVIKVVNEGMQPVFFAGLRSAGAVICIGLWMCLRGSPPRVRPGTFWPGILIGLCFTGEFLLLFIALDLTTVVRSSIIFYSMPLWLALGAHFLLPDEPLTARRGLGLALAFAGVAWAMADRGPEASRAASFAGDLGALGAAICWAGIVLVARGTSLRSETPEMSLFWQVAVSAPILLAVSPFYGGALLRDPQAIHWAGFAFQTVGVVSAGFIFWFWLLSRYPSWVVASFSFLTPLVAVGMGWLFLGEAIGPSILISLVLVMTGIVLINRPSRTASVRRGAGRG